MHGRLTLGIALLRVVGLAALILLLWNPVATHRLPASEPPLVLLDASLSMRGYGATWSVAADSARRLARGGVVWRFGTEIAGQTAGAALDTSPPTAGDSRLAPALSAAAGRGGPVAIVTDGAITDRAEIPPDLLRLPKIVLLPRASFFDAFVAAVDGPNRITASDTLRLRVSYGTAGRREAGSEQREAGSGKREAKLTATIDRMMLASQRVPLPDSGIVSTELTLPAARFPAAGWHALSIRLEGVNDSEPRDDARLFPVEVSAAPAIVVLAEPPDWDVRFLARTLSDVARAPLRMFSRTAGAGTGEHWIDAASLTPVSQAEVHTAVSQARLLVEGGDPANFGHFPARAALLRWPTRGGQDGDWYFDLPPISPAAPALGGISWDSLPPAVSLAAPAVDSGGVAVLTARLARRGLSRPAVVLSEVGGTRRAEIGAAGLYRWVFRGGRSAEAYRALVAALADWLLAEHRKGAETRAIPDALVVPNGMPLGWRWIGWGTPEDLVATLTNGDTARQDTLRWNAAGRSALVLPPGIYRYRLGGGGEQGMIAVDTYSDEWRPAEPVLRAQPGAGATDVLGRDARDRWWLFALALGAFAGEWAWRRRQGMP